MPASAVMWPCLAPICCGFCVSISNGESLANRVGKIGGGQLGKPRARNRNATHGPDARCIEPGLSFLPSPLYSGERGGGERGSLRMNQPPHPRLLSPHHMGERRKGSPALRRSSPLPHAHARGEH